jgi:hypothetical protein
MDAQANPEFLRGATTKRWVTVSRGWVCLDETGREVASVVGEWLEPPYAPKWSPHYARARRLRKRWTAGRRTNTRRDQKPPGYSFVSERGKGPIARIFSG